MVLTRNLSVDVHGLTCFGRNTNMTKADSFPSSQGLARVGRQIESGGGGDRIAGLTMASRAMKLKSKGASMMDLRNREVSARRQVGDAESVVNPQSSGAGTPWWRNVGMEVSIPQRKS